MEEDEEQDEYFEFKKQLEGWTEGLGLLRHENCGTHFILNIENLYPQIYFCSSVTYTRTLYL